LKQRGGRSLSHPAADEGPLLTTAATSKLTSPSHHWTFTHSFRILRSW